jgi:acyl-CoA dehydrogenase
MQGSSATDSLIESSAARILAAHCSAEQLQAAEGSWSEALWRALDEAAFTRALEPAGGEMGIPVADALHIVRTAGRFCTPTPLIESMLAHWLLTSVGLEAEPGPMTVAPSVRDDDLRLEQIREGWRLTGTATRVPWARYARSVVIVARAAGDEYLARVPATAFASITPGDNLAREPRDTIRLEAILEPAAVRPFPPGIDHVFSLGAALRVLQMAGALDSVLHLTVEYAQTRKQFGRPIGKFQAVQQNLAILATQVAASRAAANLTIDILARGHSPFGLAAAKLRTNEAATIAAKMAHQIHGAMGFTQEYALHFLTRRLWSWRDEFGSEAAWSRLLGAAVRERGPAGVWAFITAEMG